MSVDSGEKAVPPDGRTYPLKIGLEAVPATLKAVGGRKIQFTRALLVIRNTDPKPISGLIPQVTLAQEGGLPHEVSEALRRDLTDPLQPEEIRQWDLYDLLATGHPGVSSKVHLFGYKAVLNWWFVLTALAEYRPAEGSPPVRTPPFRARFRWDAQPAALDTVDLSIELF